MKKGLIIILAVGGIAMIFFTTTVSPESIAIGEVNIGNEKILIKGKYC